MNKKVVISSILIGLAIVLLIVVGTIVVMKTKTGEIGFNKGDGNGLYSGENSDKNGENNANKNGSEEDNQIQNSFNENSISNKENEDNKDAEGEEYHSFVATILEETNTYLIVEPNEDETERKSADKIQISLNEPYKDYLYGVGRKVIIEYVGGIMETYPAQVKLKQIRLDGYKDFEISVVESNLTSGNTYEVRRVLNNAELDKYNGDFDLYYYNLTEVNVTVNGQTMPLEDALRSGKITIDGILSKANRDVAEAKAKIDAMEEWQSAPAPSPFENVYRDGGSTEWHYDGYTIIKVHKADTTKPGARDVFICKVGTELKDVEGIAGSIGGSMKVME